MKLLFCINVNTIVIDANLSVLVWPGNSPARVDDKYNLRPIENQAPALIVYHLRSTSSHRT